MYLIYSWQLRICILLYSCDILAQFKCIDIYIYLAQCSDTTCSDNELTWIEIATESEGASQTDVFKYLDFDSTYDTYSVCDIVQYKFEYGYDSATDDYDYYVIFELSQSDEEYPIFTDSQSYID